MRIKARLISAGVVAASVMCVAAGLAFASSEDPEPSKDELIAKLKTPSSPADDGVPPNDVQQAVADRITTLMTPQDETARDPDGVPPQLANGVVGWVGIPTDGYDIVAGAGEDTERISENLTTGLPPEAENYVRVTQASVSAVELAQIWREVGKLAWSSRERPTFSLDIDAEAAQIVVSVDESMDADDRKALLALGGEHLRVEVSDKIGRLSRTNDTYPHWGGARLDWSAGDAFCTSGFTVVGNETGTHYSLTAGHCGANGSAWYATAFFGNMAGKANYPEYDQARLKNSTYDNYLYTDGEDNFGARLVTGANDGSGGSHICASGSYTGSVCGIEITSFSALFCDDDGCTPYLGKGVKSGTEPVQAGDSGGPMYYRNTSEARASVRGIIVASNAPGNVLWERYNSIAGHLGVTAITSP